MNNNKEAIVKKILGEYTSKEVKENEDLLALKELDKEVKRPANIFAYTFGTVGALVAGTGMSFLMTDIGWKLISETFFIPEQALMAGGLITIVGMVVGIVGFTMTLVNYPIYKKILEKRRNKYADQILALSEKILAEENK